MRPTLYADDRNEAEFQTWMPDGTLNFDHGKYNYERAQVLDRVLPLRCPNIEDADHDRLGCFDCDGRGFLYPDQPDWFDDTWNNLQYDGGPPTMAPSDLWPELCEQVWRHMGILEDDS